MNMKSLWALFVVLVLVGGLSAFVFYQKNQMVKTDVKPVVEDQTPMQANPTAPGTPFLGAIASISEASISVKASDNSTRSFAISAATPVISTVEAGVVGRGLADLKAGDQVVVKPDMTDATKAENIQVLTPPPFTPPPAGTTPVSITGIVAAHSATSVTVTDQATKAPVIVTLNKNTKVISNVAAGQKGKTLSSITDGSTYVNINANKTASSVTAASIQILVPITQLTNK